MAEKFKKKGLILLSGGLDSLVALGVFKDKYGIDFALTFDYGQKSAEYEISSSQKICEYYSINHKVIRLDWLREITKTALVSSSSVPTDNLGTKESAESVWVPNRNGLFLNIAACFADSNDYKYIIFGANKDEGRTFSDNTEEFRADMSQVFKSSTLSKPQVIAPLINYSKDDIVKVAIENSIPLNLVRSCYNSNGYHCGVCESCRHLKNALLNNGAKELVRELFKE